MNNDHLYVPGLISDWFNQKGWEPFDFQLELWEKYKNGYSGLLNAPTGTGKTLAVWVPALSEWITENTEKPDSRKPPGLQVLWITPLRALARDTELALNEFTSDIGVNWEVLRRTGDSSSSLKQRILRKPPTGLITTPESLHLMIARKNHEKLFSELRMVVVDEWHELLGSKRGTMVELGLSRLRAIRPELKVWGISATLGNMDHALEVLTPGIPESKKTRITSKLQKETRVTTILPEKPEAFSWAGHTGSRLIPKLLPVLHESSSTIIFTNTRAQAEIWYQKLLESDDDLAGQMALHHGSIDPDIRQWVEDAIHSGKLKVTVATSSLDLGVDFSPVDTVVQVGSPKGVARFLQRAGRSGHKPGAVSKVYFVPTHGMEIIESAALQTAVKKQAVESRKAIIKPLDLLVQYLCTLAVGDGFIPDQAFREIKSTYAFKDVTDDEWRWILKFLSSGGVALKQYDEYNRVTLEENRYVIRDRKKAMRHRLSIGTISADPSLKVRFISGGFIGTVEESFISKLNSGDTFLFAGRFLEFIRLKDLTVYVRKSKATKGAVSRWMGGRMQLSTHLSAMIRLKMEEAISGTFDSPEMEAARPLLEIQQERSALPRQHQLLIERIKTREGRHLFFYPVAGRMVHEGLASLFAWRISQISPVTFSIAMNDYGFELLSAKEAPLEEALENGLLSVDSLSEHISKSINAAELAKRHFREIARISGLIFSGYPGNRTGSKHLQASSGLLFDVFQDYDPGNLLIQQAFREIMAFQLEEERMRNVMSRISKEDVLVVNPDRFTPFSFPIMVDRLRGRLSSEKLQDRIERMKLKLEP